MTTHGAAAAAAATAATSVPSESELLAALPEIERRQAWHELSTRFKRTLLSPTVLAELLAIGKTERAEALARDLDAAGVDSVGALLVAANDIDEDGKLKPNAALPASLPLIQLKVIAALRDRVSAVHGVFLVGLLVLLRSRLTHAFTQRPPTKRSWRRWTPAWQR